MNELLGAEKFRIAGLQRRIFHSIAESYVNCGDVLHFEPELEPVQVRELADAIADRVSGTAAVFSGTDERGYSFCLMTRQGDLRALCREMTQTLGGRGGGKPGFQQGRVTAARRDIEGFFQK